MCPLRRYPILQTVLTPFRRSQQKTLALAARAQANSLAVAGHLAGELSPPRGSALNRFYRLRRNPRLDAQRLTVQLLWLLGRGQRLLLTIDGTAWHHDRRLVVAAVVVGCRGIPVQVAAFSQTDSPRSQTLRETIFLPRFVHTLRALEQAAGMRCDRGLRRTSGLRHLQEFRQAVVVRLVPDILGHRGSSRGRPFRDWHRAPGQAIDLGWVLWRQERAVRVRVVGGWARGQRDPWGLATDLAAPLAELVALYARRLTGEEQCRDTTGGRVGVRLEGTPCRTPAYLARFTRWVGVALVRWTAVGQAGATAPPNVRLPGKHKGPRLSRRRIGIQ
jgi:hypothetical protein